MLRALDRYHGMATGVFNGDECLAGTNPSQGTELCAVVEYFYSLAWLVGVLGDPAAADRLESIAFNALPATFSPDMWVHQYDQQVNQVECSVREDRIWNTNGPDSNVFGLARAPAAPRAAARRLGDLPHHALELRTRVGRRRVERGGSIHRALARLPRVRPRHAARQRHRSRPPGARMARGRRFGRAAHAPAHPDQQPAVVQCAAVHQPVVAPIRLPLGGRPDHDRNPSRVGIHGPVP